MGRVGEIGTTRRVPARRVLARDATGTHAPTSRGTCGRVWPPLGVCFIFLDSSRRALAPRRPLGLPLTLWDDWGSLRFRGFLILEEHREGHGMTKFQTFHMMEILPKTFYMMGILFFPCTGFFLLTGFFVGVSFILVVVGVLTFFVIGLAAVFLVIYIRELISNDNRHPVAGPIFNLLIHFNRLFNYQTSLARKYSTYRLITPFKSDVYTADPVNVEYILKTKFSNYGKGKFNSNLMRDLFGDGIFAVDGEKWRHQRKLASYEFSTKVLRDFSATVFRTNAAKLASDISIAATTKQMIDLQEKIAQEVREATEAEDNISTDEFANKLTEAALEKMWYLHVALTETLRLYPAVPVDGKNSEEDDILPDGFKVKKGDGAGPRICLGKEFAYRQMKILASSLLFFFKFKLVDESKEATYRTMFTLHMDKGLHLYAFSCL
ncbi:hypothetical protein HYC85_013582 [Camellia sinensis]|uniref:Cytochrome P450 n=1 Tax=Camellia sinensis TaxID=4442 RepID=A0A7J7H531_CAMSI|nr:hypothetical protein HYC85_013582 [Camellia sinensis]